MSLPNLPVELVLDNILPNADVKDVLSLGATNKTFAQAVEDDTYWKRKAAEDFNFTGAGTARINGWKFIYKKLSLTKLYVWGESDRGRLGVSRDAIPRVGAGKIPYPVRLRIPRVRIVEVVGGAWSMYFLDSNGTVFVTGTMNGEMASLRSEGFSVPEKQADSPLMLQLPEPVRALSCGRRHFLTLDAKQQVWTWLNWGRPMRMTSPSLDHSSPETTVIQVESGWSFCSALTQSGDVLVWWPFDGSFLQGYQQKMREMNEEGGKHAHAKDGTIPCVTWDYDTPLQRLPSLPQLPDLPEDSSAHNRLERFEGTKLIKIAGLDNQLIGLTNRGHVLKFDELTGPGGLSGQWVYLPLFSDISQLGGNAAYQQNTNTRAPKALHVTHVSANFRTFTAYSLGTDSVVLMGGSDTKADTPAKVIPELQNKNVISVVLGDYHYGALTSDGKLYTWGAFSNGALGLGDPHDLQPGTPGAFADSQLRHRRQISVPNVTVPTEVRFDHQLRAAKKGPRDYFCLAATAAGWHMGALAFSLSDEDDEDDIEDEAEKISRQVPGSFDAGPSEPSYPTPGLPTGPGEMPVQGGFGGLWPFRVGFAGRGRGPH